MFTILFVAIAPLLFADLIDRAVQRSGQSHKAVALAMGYTPPRWSREKAEGSVSLRRLARAPESFRIALLEELLPAFGGERPLTAHDVVAIVARAVAPNGGKRCA